MTHIIKHTGINRLKYAIYLLALGVFCLNLQSAKAQTLEEFLQSAYDNHPELLYNMQGLQQQYEGDYASIAGRFLPSLTYSHQNSYTRRNPGSGLSTRQAGGLRPLSSIPGLPTPAPGQLNPLDNVGTEIFSGQPIRDGNGNIVGFSADTITVPTGGGSATKSRSTGWNLQLRQNLFRSFADVHSLQAFLKNIDALEATYYAQEQGFMLNAIDAYLNVIRRRNVVSVRLTNYESLQERLAIVKRLYDIGDTTELDLQQSNAQLLSARSQWEQALAQYEGAVANFRRYGAMEPDAPELPEGMNGIPATQEQGESAVLAGNFELRGLEMAQKITKSIYRATQLSTGVTVDLSINYQDGTQHSGNRGGGITSSNSSTSTQTTVTASLPLYNPQHSSQIRSAYQGYLRSRNNYERSRLDNIQNFQIQWASYKRATDIVEYQRQAVEAAQIALDNVILQRRAGLQSIVNVLDEETRLIQAQVAYEDARYSHLISGYQILLYTGQLTAEDLGLQTKYDVELKKYFQGNKGFGGAAPGAWTVFKTLDSE